MGRKPKPLSLQIAEGDTRKRGRLKLRQELANQPKGIPILPPPPPGLDAEERGHYEEIAAGLDFWGLADATDVSVVAMAAIACNQARNKKTGEALRTALAYLSSLGLGGPASRVRLPIEKAASGEKDLMAMLSAPRATRYRNSSPISVPPKEKVQ